MGWLNLNRWWLILTTFALALWCTALGATGWFPGVTLSRSQGDTWFLERLGVERVRQAVCGRGIVVAVVDSGVDAKHPMLEGHVVSELAYSFGDNGTDVYDALGHGTGVAGAILEVAPCARILPLKVNRGGEPFFDSEALARALEYVAKLLPEHPEIRVVNLSLSLDEPDPEVERAVERLVEMGVVVVAAAGNGEGVKFPASLPGVVAVAGTDMWDGPAPFSGHGKQVVVSAPAEEIRVPEPGVGFADMYGTSVAAALVSGVVALLEEAEADNPVLALAEGSKDLGEPGYDEEFGFGRVSAFNSVLEALSGCGAAVPGFLELREGEAEKVVFGMWPPGNVNFTVLGNGVEAQAEGLDAVIVRGRDTGEGELLLWGSCVLRVGYRVSESPRDVLEVVPITREGAGKRVFCFYIESRGKLRGLYLAVTEETERGFERTTYPLDAEVEPNRRLAFCVGGELGGDGLNEVLLCAEGEGHRCVRHTFYGRSALRGELSSSSTRPEGR